MSDVECITLSKNQALSLEAPMTDLLIYETLKGMKKNKAPSPDRVNVDFYLTTWATTGRDFCEAVKHFFNTGIMPSCINSTFISLISKSTTPTKMQDFRPISLCSVMYKCISKKIASRLKKIPPSIVYVALSAFIQGRSISDNILLAQELFRGYDRESGASKCALKIDLHKAFDSLKWDFILAVLHKIRVPSSVNIWISACLCTTRFSVKHNGIIHGYFQGTQRLRQGDPMFMYIFALCMNILSCVFNKFLDDFKFH